MHPSASDPRWELLKQKANEARASRAFELFRKAGVEPILIKGIAAAQYYPQGAFRDAVDLDLAVAPEDFDQAARVVFSDDAKGLAIDLHRGLRHLDSLSWQRLFGRSHLVDLEMGSVRFLSDEDNLRILATHWLTDGGANRDRLLDIVYLVEHRRNALDWHSALSEIPDFRRRYVGLVLGVAREEFALDLSGVPIEERFLILPKWFDRTIRAEWNDETKFRPLHDSMSDFGTFARQLRKRIPPNPITATALLGGDLDSPVLFRYQLESSFRRIVPSIRNMLRSLRGAANGR